MSSGGLVVVTAHPDDEVLIAGGTLAACAAAGLPTAVVCLTQGELGPISDPALASRKNLAEVRVRELKAACAELGVGWVRCYRRGDGSLRWSNGAAIVRQLERVLRERTPDAVITFGEDGIYYHADHIAAYEYTRRAVERVVDPPALYLAVWPSALMSELVQELKRRRLPADLWEQNPESFGTDQLNGSFELDLRAFAQRKLEALRCHRTQFGAGHALTELPADLAERFLGFERFVRLPSDGASEDRRLLETMATEIADA